MPNPEKRSKPPKWCGKPDYAENYLKMASLKPSELLEMECRSLYCRPTKEKGTIHPYRFRRSKNYKKHAQRIRPDFKADNADNVAFALLRGGWPEAVNEDNEEIALKTVFDYVETLINDDMSRKDT